MLTIAYSQFSFMPKSIRIGDTHWSCGNFPFRFAPSWAQVDVNCDCDDGVRPRCTGQRRACDWRPTGYADGGRYSARAGCSCERALSSSAAMSADPTSAEAPQARASSHRWPIRESFH